MGAIHVHEFISLDGVIDAPVWTSDYGFDPKMGEVLARGHRAQPRHPARSHDVRDVRAGVVDPHRRGRSRAPFFNDTTKYVVSGTLTDPTWRNSEVIGRLRSRPDRRLKDEVDGDLYVSGSGTLVRAMLADGLVDALHLFMYPPPAGPARGSSRPSRGPSDLTLAACDATTTAWSTWRTSRRLTAGRGFRTSGSRSVGSAQPRSSWGQKQIIYPKERDTMKYLMLVVRPTPRPTPRRDRRQARWTSRTWVSKQPGRRPLAHRRPAAAGGGRDHGAPPAAASCWSPTARSPSPASGSSASTSSSAPTSTRPSRSPPSTRWPAGGRLELRPFWPVDADRA